MSVEGFVGHHERAKLEARLAEMERRLKALERENATLRGRVAAHSEILAVAGLRTIAPPRGDVDPGIRKTPKL